MYVGRRVCHEEKEHSGSAAVIGAQLVILFILTVSLCVQSRKAAAENTYAVMEESGEGSRAGEPEKPGKRGTAGRRSTSIGWNLMFRRM